MGAQSDDELSPAEEDDEMQPLTRPWRKVAR